MQIATSTATVRESHLATTSVVCPDQPHFLGLAHLRSLLSHDEVACSGERTDSVLDMISVLLQEGPARKTVQAFCHVREVCQPVCYLALFRLRRWLEQNIVIRVNHGHWHAMSLSFQNYRKLVQHYRREAWEWNEGETAMQDMEVRFAWKHEIMANEQASADATAVA